MRQWGLADKADATFASLSGGQRQCLFVALALVNEPEVVFLDEMTRGTRGSASDGTNSATIVLIGFGVAVAVLTVVRLRG